MKYQFCILQTTLYLHIGSYSTSRVDKIMQDNPKIDILNKCLPLLTTPLSGQKFNKHPMLLFKAIGYSKSIK